MVIRTKTLLTLVCCLFGFIALAPTSLRAAGATAIVAPQDQAQAVEQAKIWMTKHLAKSYQSIQTSGEKRPQVVTAKLSEERQSLYVVKIETTPHIHPAIPGSSKRKGTIYQLLVSKKSGRVAFGDIKSDVPLISPYASFARCASPLLSLLNKVFIPGFQNGSEDFSSRAYGSHYYCLLPFFGKHVIGSLPVQPRVDKLPAWAQKDKTQLANGLRLYMFPEAFPANFWAENSIKAQAKGDADVLTAVSLYPQFAKSLGVACDAKVQPLKLTDWAQHGVMYSQDTRERLSAELLLQQGVSAGLKITMFRFGGVDVIMIGKGRAEDTFFATFDAASIHSEINYGRPVAGKLTLNNKTMPSLAQLIVEGDTLALSVALNNSALRTLLSKASKDPFAARASKMLAEF